MLTFEFALVDES